jgi:hypothetical protein
MTRIIITYTTFLLLSLFSTASMCNKENAEDDNNDPEYTSLIGYWKLKLGQTFAIKDDGQQIVTATLNPGVFAHEFFSDGTYKGHNLIGTEPGESGTWKLTVTALDDKDIEDGILSITTPSTQSLAGELFVDADGSLKYSIASINNPADGGKPIITLTTKQYEAYPYSKNWAVYVLEKQ